MGFLKRRFLKSTDLDKHHRVYTRVLPMPFTAPGIIPQQSEPATAAAEPSSLGQEKSITIRAINSAHELRFTRGYASVLSQHNVPTGDSSLSSNN